MSALRIDASHETFHNIMATFQVPQFIDQKPKIIGPLTLKQFAFIAVATLLSFFAYYLFDLLLWIIISLFVESIALLLALGKINGQDSTTVLKAAIMFLTQPRLFIWERNFSEKAVEKKSRADKARQSIGAQEKLKSISLNVTTGKTLSPKAFRDEQKKKGFEEAIFSTGEKRLVKKIDYKE